MTDSLIITEKLIDFLISRKYDELYDKLLQIKRSIIIKSEMGKSIRFILLYDKEIPRRGCIGDLLLIRGEDFKIMKKEDKIGFEFSESDLSGANWVTDKENPSGPNKLCRTNNDNSFKQKCNRTKSTNCTNQVFHNSDERRIN